MLDIEKIIMSDKDRKVMERELEECQRTQREIRQSNIGLTKRIVLLKTERKRIQRPEKVKEDPYSVLAEKFYGHRKK